MPTPLHSLSLRIYRLCRLAGDQSLDDFFGPHLEALIARKRLSTIPRFPQSHGERFLEQADVVLPQFCECKLVWAVGHGRQVIRCLSVCQTRRAGTMVLGTTHTKRCSPGQCGSGTTYRDVINSEAPPFKRPFDRPHGFDRVFSSAERTSDTGRTGRATWGIAPPGEKSNRRTDDRERLGE